MGFEKSILINYKINYKINYTTIYQKQKQPIEYLKMAAHRGNVKSIHSYATELFNGDKIDQNY